MRVINLVGVSYTGSTVVSGLLSTLPGVTAVGELYHLTPPSPPTTFYCRSCGGTCKLVKPATVPPLEYYDEIRQEAERQGYQVLVIADKLFWELIKPRNRPGESEAIVLLKRPEALAFSFVNHYRQGQGCYESHTAALNGINDHYRLINKNLGFFSQAHFLSLERLAGNPEWELARLCRALALPPPEFPLRPPRDWHIVKCNTEAYERVMRNDYALDVRWQQQLSAAEVAIIRAHPYSEIYAEMLDRAV